MASNFSALLSTPQTPLRPADLPPTFRPGPKTPGISNQAEAAKVGREFETMFLSEMLQPMFAGMGTDKLFGGGNGEKMFRSLQVEQYAKALTKSGGVGIADAVKREVIRMQENARVPTAP
jgi:Rod binding domain-containing protein